MSQCDFGLAKQIGNGRTQVVRHVGRELAHLCKAGGQPREHRIEGGNQRRQTLSYQKKSCQCGECSASCHQQDDPVAVVGQEASTFAHDPAGDDFQGPRRIRCPCIGCHGHEGRVARIDRMPHCRQGQRLCGRHRRHVRYRHLARIVLDQRRLTGKAQYQQCFGIAEHVLEQPRLVADQLHRVRVLQQRADLVDPRDEGRIVAQRQLGFQVPIQADADRAQHCHREQREEQRQAQRQGVLFHLSNSQR
ncbi:MAG: hypothetical protein H7327_04675 [Herminiimonas sp.]|nr:hypothetical protein [Herminiimonas sp.]